MTDQSFREFVLEQLGGLGPVHCRPMFGGHGLYHGERFFAILHRGRLYFKTAEHHRPRYRDLGMEPFRPNPRQILRNYYEVPGEVLEDGGELVRWAREAASAGD